MSINLYLGQDAAGSVSIGQKQGDYTVNRQTGVPLGDIIQGGRQAVEILRSLSNGDSFNAVVTDVKGGYITLKLEGGQSFTANLQNNVSYNIGDSVRFLIQDNQGENVVLKSLNLNESAVERAIVDKSLEAAGIFPSDRNREMVVERMRSNMPISREALLEMVKDVTANPQASVKDIVDLSRMKLDITPENLSAYDNYRSYNGALQEDIALIGDNLKNAVTDGRMLEELVLVFKDETSDGITLKDNSPLLDNQMPAALDGEAVFGEGKAVLDESAVSSEQSRALQGGIAGPASDDGMTARQQAVVNEIIEELDKTVTNYNTAMGKSPAEAFRLPEALTSAGNVTDFLYEFAKTAQELESQPLIGKHVTGLLKSERVSELVLGMLKDSFSAKPSELTQEGAVKERTLRNISRLNQLTGFAQQSGNSSLAELSSNMRNNMEFLNNMNSFIAAAQIPLKHIGEDGSGELYVYRRKNHASGQQDVLKAYLHLDMEHLGALDIYVTLNNNNVSTNFKVEDEKILDFLEDNIHILTERLNEAGYNVSTTVGSIDDGTGFDFVEEALIPQLPVNEVKRFRFDVKA